MAKERENYVYIAKLAEQAERYEGSIYLSFYFLIFYFIFCFMILDAFASVCPKNEFFLKGLA